MGLGRLKALFARARERAGWFDHVIRAVVRYKLDGGDRLAASLTYYGFLSLLPLLLLSLSVLGFVLANDPTAQTRVFERITTYHPGVGNQIAENLHSVQRNRTTTGLVGVVGLLLAGLGGMSALRDGLRLMWHQETGVGSIARTKLWDVVTLAGLSLTLLVSIGVSALGAGLASFLLDRAGVTGALSHGALTVASLALAFAADTALFLYLFRRLPQCAWPYRQVLRGAMFGAAGFGVLKYAATAYVTSMATRSEALYGTLGTVLGLLVGINLIARWVLLAAAWTVTAPGDDDVPPSDAAMPEAGASNGRERDGTEPYPEEPRRAGMMR